MASKRRLRDKECNGKQAYDSLAMAVRAAIAIRHRVTHRLHAYRCSFCPFFHLGHPPARIRNKIKAMIRKKMRHA